jgi:aminoglycoside phosphotransferase (APT) family kinase protein
VSETFAMARARHALEEAGLDSTRLLERADSVTNEVWLAGDVVVRVNQKPNQRLRREAALGPHLASEVGYPGIVAYGGQLGADFLIVERRPGTVLSRCWPGMTPEERRAAVRQLAELVGNLHRIDCPSDLPDVEGPYDLIGGHGFNAVEPLLAAVDRLTTLSHVDHGWVDELRSLILDTAWTIEPFTERTIVHGDLHFQNVLWDGRRISALLDFEYARPGPPDLDLDTLLRFCAYPFLFVAEDYEHLTRTEDYALVPYWMAEDDPDLFANPQVFERTRIYAIAYDVRDLLANPPPRPPRELSRFHPFNRIDMLLRGTSHLHRLAGRQSYDPMDFDLTSLSAVEVEPPTDQPPPLSGRVAPRAATTSEPAATGAGAATGRPPGLPKRRVQGRY